MVDVERSNLINVPVALVTVAKSTVSESHHVFAVYLVAQLQVVLPDEKVGQRYREIVHTDRVEEMFLAVVHQPVEAAVGLSGASELQQRKALVEYLVRLGVVVVQRGSGFGRSERSLLPALACLVGVAQSLV